jgi:hypothetical protein
MRKAKASARVAAAKTTRADRLGAKMPKSRNSTTKAGAHSASNDARAKTVLSAPDKPIERWYEIAIEAAMLVTDTASVAIESSLQKLG